MRHSMKKSADLVTSYIHEVLTFVIVLLISSMLTAGTDIWHEGNNRTTECTIIDDLCIPVEEVASYEAIKALHSQIDDDHDGDIDFTESVDFIIGELQHTRGIEHRQEKIHLNNDEHISSKDLWLNWRNSEVHNWTLEQALAWLTDSVELGQYTDVFVTLQINGSQLPRLVLNTEASLLKDAGIRNPAHRSKISIKAMDVVLFGQPKETGSIIKDAAIFLLLLIVFVGSAKFYQCSRMYEDQLHRLLKDMETLREEEQKFCQELRKKDEGQSASRASPVSNSTPSGTRNGSISLPQDDENDTYHGIEWESESLATHTVESQDLDSMCVEEYDPGGETGSESFLYTPPPRLQQWLQLTYERERVNFERKKSLAQEQFQQAKELCDKLKPQRRRFMGTFALVHGRMDSMGHAISKARDWCLT